MIPGAAFVVGPGRGSLLLSNQTVLGTSPVARGGVAIENGADGLDVKDWSGRVSSERFYLSAPGVPEFDYLAVPGALSATFAFDRNMAPAVCWNTPTGAQFYWYDSAIPGYTTTAYPGVTNAMVTHDDVRNIAESRSDVVLVYQRAGGVYYRQQRERYLIEHTIAAEAEGDLIQCGMGNQGRLLVKLLRRPNE